MHLFFGNYLLFKVAYNKTYDRHQQKEVNEAACDMKHKTCNPKKKNKGRDNTQHILRRILRGIKCLLYTPLIATVVTRIFLAWVIFCNLGSYVCREHN